MSKIDYKQIINQKYIDNVFSCLDGYGKVDDVYDDCKMIQKSLHEEYNIYLSISECQRFWKWRSELWDASFLRVSSKDEVIDFFNQYIKENDVDCYFEENNLK